MNGNKLHNDENFDEVLFHSISELTPEDAVVNQVTPWRKNMNLVLIGIILQTQPFDIFHLKDVLSYLGIILMMLGFHGLRKENKWFLSAEILAIFHFIRVTLYNSMEATIFRSEILQKPYMNILIQLGALTTLFIFLCLWGGFHAVQKKAGGAVRWKCNAALVFWYLILYGLALIEYHGWLLTIIMLVCYCFIFYHTFRLSKELDDVGYAITSALVYVPRKVIVAAIFALQLSGIIVGYTRFNQYPMNWEMTESKKISDADSLKLHLKDLGIPEYVLKDMSEKDLNTISNAKKVLVQEEYFPVNDDQLHITSVAVQLSNDKTRWQIIHHFNWDINPGFVGTDAIALYSDLNEPWKKDRSTISGKIYYNMKNSTYASDYYQIKKSKKRMYDVIATFSFPKNGENCRGYLTYLITGDDFSTIAVGQMNYFYQKHQFQYPVQTVWDYLKDASPFSSDDMFMNLYSPMVFRPEIQEIE